jgi:hypothetical protein
LPEIARNPSKNVKRRPPSQSGPMKAKTHERAKPKQRSVKRREELTWVAPSSRKRVPIRSIFLIAGYHLMPIS